MNQPHGWGWSWSYYLRAGSEASEVEKLPCNSESRGQRVQAGLWFLFGTGPGDC